MNNNQQHEIPGFINGKTQTKTQTALDVLAIIVLFSIGAALAAGAGS